VTKSPTMAAVAGPPHRVDRVAVGPLDLLVVADVMVAGDAAHGQSQAVVQAPRLGQIPLGLCTVERDVAAVEHQVRAIGSQGFSHPREVRREEWLLGAEVRVGDLGDAIGHGRRLVVFHDDCVAPGQAHLGRTFCEREVVYFSCCCLRAGAHLS
jgi:hypothetical protein